MVHKKICIRCGNEYLAGRIDSKQCGCRKPKPEELRHRCSICDKAYESRNRKSSTCSRECSKKLDYLKHSDDYKKRSAEWYSNNFERAVKNRKKYYWENPDYFRKKAREYYRENHGFIRRKDSSYKDKKRHGGNREKLLIQYDYKCQNCGIDTREGWRNSIVHHETFNAKDHSKQTLLSRSCHLKLHWKHKRRKNVET